MRHCGSAALSCAARARFIGWTREQQYTRLIHSLVEQLDRFLCGVQVCLA